LSDLDFKLLGGRFINNNLSPEFSYLYKYFKSELCRAFVVYYLSFSELIKQQNIMFFVSAFIDHTGYKCSRSRLYFLVNRLQYLISATKEAENNFDLTTIELIKSGRYKLGRRLCEARFGVIK